MNIHEYQAKELLAKYGVPVPAGYAAMSVDDAVEAAQRLPGPLWVVKAQIHAGGRGKGKFKELGEAAKGGVRLAHSIDEVREHAAEMLGKTLGTVQTGPAGQPALRIHFTDGDDLTEEDPMEIEASKYDLSYIKLDGSIGCMVNGAGLAMATMDIIKLEGAEPANFLDVGGGANKEKVTAAFKIILSDPAVKGILVNIFGGIMRCDIIAEGIVAAAREVSLNVPLVVRLEGTNVQQGKDILASSGLPIIAANDLGDAARKIVAEVKAPVAA